MRILVFYAMFPLNWSVVTVKNWWPCIVPVMNFMKFYMSVNVNINFSTKSSLDKAQAQTHQLTEENLNLRRQLTKSNGDLEVREVAGREMSMSVTLYWCAHCPCRYVPFCQIEYPAVYVSFAPDNAMYLCKI